jgi:hypothetical protein
MHESLRELFMLLKVKHNLLRHWWYNNGWQIVKTMLNAIDNICYCKLNFMLLLQLGHHHQ